MASLIHSNNKVPKESFFSKVQNIAETIGTIKGLYDAGKMIYSGIQTVAPIIRTAAVFL